MLTVVYMLCAGTCLACAVVLLRAWRRTKLRLLLWSGLCFVGLLGENVLLLADVWAFSSVEVAVVRRSLALAGVTLLLVGLVWETR
jgi:hypothetical protein